MGFICNRIQDTQPTKVSESPSKEKSTNADNHDLSFMWEKPKQKSKLSKIFPQIIHKPSRFYIENKRKGIKNRDKAQKQNTIENPERLD